jgi:hypothetical protein
MKVIEAKTLLTVNQYFECPKNRCSMAYHEGDEILVEFAPMDCSATHDCEICGTEIELIVNDDDTVEL